MFQLLPALATLIPLSTQASINCAGVLTKAFTDSTGNVIIYAPWRGEWTQICNLNSTWSGVEPATCFGWFSVVNTAIFNGKSINIYYTHAQADCTTLAVYGNSQPPGYVMLTNP